LAALLRMTPLLYLDDYVWVREGEEIIIPGTDNEYYIENKKFTLEVYDKDDPRFKDALEKAGEVHKGYTTEVKISKVKEDAVVGAADELEVVKTDKLMMNHPVKFDGYTLYQSGYQENEFKTMYFDVVKANDENQEVIDSIEVDLRNPEETYELADGLRVQMEQFYPDYALEDGQPITKTKYPRNPAFVFSVFPPESDEGELSFLGIGQNIDPTGENEY